MNDELHESWIARRRSERAPADFAERVMSELDDVPATSRSVLELCACAAALVLGISRFAYLAFVARLIG